MNDFTQPKAVTLPGEGRGHSFEHEIFRDLLDDYGKPRLKWARNKFLQDLDQAAVPVLAEAFQFWRDFSEYLLLYGKNRVNGKELWIGVKCSKRGNDVFSRRLDRKLGFLRQLEGIDLFHLEDFEKKPYMPSNLLFVTLTFNPHLCSLKEAWEKIGYYWNLWITNMRNKYGRILHLAMPEAFPNPEGAAYGYPHIHTVLLFEDHEFNAFPSWEKMRDGSEGWAFRILEREEIKKQGKWMAHVDIKAINSGRGLARYLRKHCKNTHGGNDPAALTTQSLLWLHRKQTFSMSSGFRKALHDSIMKLASAKNFGAQKTLDGRILDDWIWTAHGIRSAFELDVDPGVWVLSLDEEKFERLVCDRYGS